MNKIPSFFGELNDDDIKRIMDKFDNSLSVEAFQNREESLKAMSCDMPFRNLRRGPKLTSYTFHITSE